MDVKTLCLVSTSTCWDDTISVGGPSTQWWTQLATAVAGGLAFATLLTLVLTPSLLVLGEKLRRRTVSPQTVAIEGAAPEPV